MDDLLDNLDALELEGESRSARWKSMRTYLKSLCKRIDVNCDRIANLEKELSDIKNTNLEISEAIQVLGDLANVETQREISLTLNDTNYEIVIDVPTNTASLNQNSDPLSPDLLDKNKLIKELKDLPRIGDKSAVEIADYIEKADIESANTFIFTLSKINDSSKNQDMNQSSLLNLCEGGEF